MELAHTKEGERDSQPQTLVMKSAVRTYNNADAETHVDREIKTDPYTHS